MTPTSLIPSTTDWAAVKKVYKLNGDPALSSVKGRPEEEREYVDGTVTSLVAAKLVLA